MHAQQRVPNQWQVSEAVQLGKGAMDQVHVLGQRVLAHLQHHHLRRYAGFLHRLQHLGAHLHAMHGKGSPMPWHGGSTE